MRVPCCARARLACARRVTPAARDTALMHAAMARGRVHPRDWDMAVVGVTRREESHDFADRTMTSIGVAWKFWSRTRPAHPPAASPTMSRRRRARRLIGHLTVDGRRLFGVSLPERI